MRQNLINFSVDGALDQITQSDYGAHYILIYPDLFTLRELYSKYIPKQIEENNGMILLNPFYETTNSARQILSRKGLDVSKCEKENTLVIIDSLKEYFGQQRQQQTNLLFIKSIAEQAKQIGKSGLSVLGDLGAYIHKSRYNDLVDYELSCPTKYDLAINGFCLYHQKDFNRLAEEQKQQLVEHHGKALNIERF